MKNVDLIKKILKCQYIFKRVILLMEYEVNVNDKAFENIMKKKKR